MWDVAMWPVPMEELAVAIREDFGNANLPTGSLGGIAYHPTRDTLWGVDIINDVYFEFNEDGSLVIENGRPKYFVNPLRDELNGGAYGNTITYASVGDGEFFDIPVGALTGLEAIWLMADIMNALMAVPNLLALLLLSPIIFKITSDRLSGGRKLVEKSDSQPAE